MENNNAAQRSTLNAQRNNYSSYNIRQKGNKEGSFPGGANQQPKSGDQESAMAAAQNFAISQKTVKTFRDLAIWQKGIALAKAIYQTTSTFPREEIYGLVAQMRRAAVSIPSNISEGYRRRHAKEFQQFLNVALGSLGELETQIIVSDELKYLADEKRSFLLEEVDHLTRMIISLNKKVER